MAKNRVCEGCIKNNNGWCEARKTNKGLKDLITCEFKATEEDVDNGNYIVKIENYLEAKKLETAIDSTSYNRGIVKGLEIALAVLKAN